MRKGYGKIAALFLLAAVFSACSDGSNVRPGKMILIPEGEFVMGSDEADTAGYAKEFGMREGKLYENEKPVRKVFLKAFYIDVFEVTNIEFMAFLSSTGYRAAFGGQNSVFYEPGKELHPVINVSWYDALNYCAWAGKRLPGEDEWEKAARGSSGSKYPWGEVYNEKAANLSTTVTKPVGSVKTDSSPFGVYDMGGNVMEWVESFYEQYPGNKTAHKDYGKKFRVVRGGSAGLPGHYLLNNVHARGSARQYAPPEVYGVDTGFRCAKSAEGK